MPLQTIGEDTTLESLDDRETQPLGHSTAYGVPASDTTSIFSHSTNSTASNLPGPGRVLGNFYSLTGKRLERTLGDLAHKAGFGPEAIYQQINKLYDGDWKTDGKKASTLQKLCLKLFEHANSIVDSTRYTAIMRWGDILRYHQELYVWLYFNQQTQTINLVNDLLRIIDEFRSTRDSLLGYEDDVLSQTSLLIDCHSVGLNVINLNRTRLLIEGGNIQVDWTDVTDIQREEIEKWDASFKYLLESLSDPTISESSRWYIDFWSSRIVEGNMHLQIALQSCRTMQCVLDSEVVDSYVNYNRWDSLAILGKRIYEYFVNRRTHPRAMLLALCDDCLPCDGVPVHISTILNDLVQSYNRAYSVGLDIVPDLTCVTMLGSTDIISAGVKEKIRGFLKDLQNDDEGNDKVFTEMMLLRSCYRLLRRALSELDDTECFIKLSNATSFTDRTSRCAMLQLGDILQSLPEVYMLLITIGGDEIRDSVESIHRSLKVYGNSTNGLERYPRILMDLRSLLACHAAGLWLASEDLSYAWPSEVNKFIPQTAPFDNKDLREARQLFEAYLTDNLTFNPMIFYLNYCISQIGRAHYLSFNEYPFLSCSIVQGALLTEKSISEENRSAMEDLCRSIQNSMIIRLPSTVERDYWRHLRLGHAMRSVYTNLTKSRQVFEDEVEVYLSQLCNIYFEFIAKTKHMEYKRGATLELSDFFGSKNILGWFLSIRGPDAEESIARLLEDIDDSNRLYPKEMQYCKGRFSHFEAHKLGVKLLAPRHEKLHFEGAGLTNHRPTRSSEPPLTPEQRERWINAFKTLAANLRSPVSYLIDISLFYFANCPLPYEADSMLDTALALEYCEKLQLVLSEDNRFESTDKNVKPGERSLEAVWGNQESRNIDESTIKENLSRAVYHIHTCLTMRVEHVQQSCMDVSRSVHTFYGTPFDIPKVVTVLAGLAKLCKEKLGADAPELLSSPDY